MIIKFKRQDEDEIRKMQIIELTNQVMKEFNMLVNQISKGEETGDNIRFEGKFYELMKTKEKLIDLLKLAKESKYKAWDDRIKKEVRKIDLIENASERKVYLFGLRKAI